MRKFVLGSTLLLVNLCACGSHDTGLVAECQQYQAKLESCFHRPVPFASQASLNPKTDEERARVRQMCSANLARLETSCR